MGLFDFVKNAGKKLFGKDDEAEKAAERAADDQARRAAREMADRRRAGALEREIESLGLGIEDLKVTVDGETATVIGTAKSQADREKAILAAGNVYGINRVDDRIVVSQTEPEATFYTVKAGDTLSKIAKEHYGNAMKYPAIFEANKPMLEHPDKIYPGQVLRIPALDD